MSRMPLPRRPVPKDGTDDTLRAIALAVSASPGGSPFDDLVRLLTTILRVDVAFIARRDDGAPDRMRMLALCCDGHVMQDIPYPLAGSPCATVVGQRFRLYASDLQGRFPDDR